MIVELQKNMCMLWSYSEVESITKLFFSFYWDCWQGLELDKIRLSLEVVVWHAFSPSFQTPTDRFCSVPDGAIGIFH
jgi:hypothetical protein